MKGACLTILIADDDPVDHEIIRLALERSRFSHCLAAVFDGSQLVDILKNEGSFSHMEKIVPDFVLLDLNMPTMDGLEALEKLSILKLTEKIPIYILTTNDEEVKRKKARKLGARNIFTKPHRLQDYEEMIDKIIQEIK